MKNHKLYTRFVAATTSVALLSGSLAPATVALADTDTPKLIDGNPLSNIANVSVDDVVAMVKGILANNGITLTAPDLNGLMQVVTADGELTGLTLNADQILKSLGVSYDGLGDINVDLTSFYELAGLSSDQVQDVAALIGGLSAGEYTSVEGYISELGIEDVTLRAIGEELANQVVKAISAVDVDKLISDLTKGVNFEGIKDAVSDDFNLNKLAEILGIGTDKLPAGFDDFNDLKDAEKLVAFADALYSGVADAQFNNVELGDIVNLVALLDALGISDESLPLDVIDGKGVKKPSEIFAEWQKLDKNDLINVKKIVDDLGFGSYELPEELFDVNNLTDPAKLGDIFNKLDLNQFLDLQMILAGLEGLEVPEGADDLNNYKKLDEALKLLLGFDFDNVVDVLGKNLGVSASDIAGLFSNLDELDDLKDMSDYGALLGGFDVDGFADLIGNRLGVSNLGGVIAALAGLNDLNDIKEAEGQKVALETLGDMAEAISVGDLVSKLLDALNVKESGTGWIAMPDGSWKYWQAETNSVRTGWLCVDGAWYHFDKFGTMQTGWQNINGTWYYFGRSGAMKSGWQFIWGHWFYLGGAGDGAMRTGEFQDETGATFFADGNGYWLG